MEHGKRKITNVEELNKVLDNIKNPVVGKALLTTYHKLNNCGYKKVLCSVSGGSDSDIVVDLMNLCDNNNIVDYVFFDTGLEYEATKHHLKYLEQKYNIEIEVIRPKVPIPLSCKNYGQPFLNKHVSEMIKRLQKHNFKWEDKSFDELYKQYPKCKSALEWWCNIKPSPSHNIKQNKLLKEFMVKNPPKFKISQDCCKYAKKDLAHDKLKEGYDLDVTGIRKLEGGVRKNAYKSCFDNNDNKYDRYRPIFWFNDDDKMYYRKLRNVSNSKCYTIYGLKRTGCCGCPFGRNYKDELNVLLKFEPKLYKASTNIFKDSYDYTQKYKNFIELNKIK